jgi:hypothetical protein
MDSIALRFTRTLAASLFISGKSKGRWIKKAPLIRYPVEESKRIPSTLDQRKERIRNPCSLHSNLHLDP